VSACDIGVRGVLGIPFMELSSPPVKADVALDARSFGRFYEDSLPRIYGYFVHRCGGSALTAEDLTQETFLAAVAELKRHLAAVVVEQLVPGDPVDPSRRFRHFPAGPALTERSLGPVFRNDP